jgi:4-hydroxy-tetrahydrodipicolinate synthase
MTLELNGVYPALTTPFAADESIDHETLRENVDRLVDAGVDGVVPVGSTGESATLTHDEHVAVVETVVAAVDDADRDVPVIAGAGSNNTREALSLSERSVDAGADALLQIAPYYNNPEQAGFEAHFRRLADAVDLPQIVYNVPSRTGRNVDPDTVVSLASHPNVAGYKAASGDLGQVAEVIERTDDERFSVLSGDDALTLPVVALGGRGTISVAANVEPRRTVDLVQAAREGKMELARLRQRELGSLFRALFVETNPIPVKAANEIRGYGPGRLRSPLTELTPENRTHLEAVLADLQETDKRDGRAVGEVS